MSEPHNFLQNSASLVAASTSASSELPTVGSILAQRRSLRSKASHSPPSLRALVTTLASVAAIVVLVLYCWRGYKRRALQNLGSRKLASSEDTDAPDDVCGNSGDEKEQKEHQGPHLPRPSGSERSKAPLKRRLLARASGCGGDGSNPQQQEKEQHRHEPSGSPLDISQLEASARAEETDGSVLPARGALGHAPMRMPGEFEAATELLNLRPGQDATGHSLPTAKETVILQVLELQRMMDTRMEQMQRQMSRIELQLQELRWQLQRNQSQEQQQQPFPLQWQAQQGLYHHQQQQHLPWQHPLWEQQQRQFLPWGHMHWQQQQQQFSLQQTQQQQNLLQHEQHYSRLPQWTENQQATQPQEPSQAAQGQEQQQTRQQKGQHVPPRDERGQQTERGGRKRKHEEEPRIMQQEQQQLLQPADPLSAFSPEEWIDPGSPGQEIYNPRTSQQELQYSAVAEPGLSTSQDHSTHLTSRYQLVTVAASRTAAAGALRDEATVAAFEGAALAGAAARPSTFEDMSVKAISGLPPPPLAASPAAVAGASREEVAGAAAGGAGAPSAGAKADVTAADAAAGSAFAVSVSTEETKEVRVTQGSTSSGKNDHPFVRLPSLAVKVPPDISIDIQKAMSVRPSRAGMVPLLQDARALLARRVLQLEDIYDLANVTRNIIEHATTHQNQNLSDHKACRAAVRLGIRFLQLDAVVSAYIVLGQKPDPHMWKIFTDAISHVSPPIEVRGGRSKQQTFFSTLCQELSTAIQLLKTGKRPDAADLLRIKRMLFSLPFSPQRFKSSEFDAWREDDRSHDDGR